MLWKMVCIEYSPTEELFTNCVSYGNMGMHIAFMRVSSIKPKLFLRGISALNPKMKLKLALRVTAVLITP